MSIDWCEFISKGWVEAAIEADGDVTTCRPPVSLILYRDLLEKGWGWDRLVPYNDGSVKWSDFKDYLETYFQKNEQQIANLCNCQNDGLLIGKGVAAENFLQAAANQCIETENMFLTSCWKYITVEDIRLCRQIKRHARLIIQSEVASSAATAGLACVIKEAELMCKSVELVVVDDPSEIITLSNEIRQSALNLMLNGGTESQNDAALAATVGIAKEAKYLCDLLSQEDPDINVKYFNCDDFRRRAATVLTMLEKEFGCGSDGNAEKNGSAPCNKSEKSNGVSTVSGLNGDESGSEENSNRGIIEHCVKDNAENGNETDQA
ncbi:hypothetical protein EJB05_36022 [Eragrostis curvula]|uniref:Uncharacterized protein n=1 Tax=Eragrostis curvula TaxID=38414 RepID=A0A5J9U937_9POAL|nr:hypothetical protein EJB05_36022 [Eragrostis curvula]